MTEIKKSFNKIEVIVNGFTHTILDYEEEGHLFFVFLKGLNGKTVGHVCHNYIPFMMDHTGYWGGVETSYAYDSKGVPK